jgi:hypothetical protein
VTPTTLPNGDILTGAGFVIPAEAHKAHLAHARRRRRQRCKYALSHNETVSFSREQLQDDGWGPRQIERLINGK